MWVFELPGDRRPKGRRLTVERGEPWCETIRAAAVLETPVGMDHPREGGARDQFHDAIARFGRRAHPEPSGRLREIGEWDEDHVPRLFARVMKR